jgi:GH15 family glucan-1,4-alpha-glucosidase
VTVALRIEDYALVGDTQTAAIVGRDGSIDWLCVPRFDSGSIFAALVGGPENGFWRIAPASSPKPGTDAPLLATSRRYRGETLVLETEFALPEGTVRVVDCMPVRSSSPQVVRVVECTAGRVAMRMDMVLRFGYGQTIPWVRRVDGMLTAIAGPDAVSFWSPVHTHGEDMSTVADFVISEGQRVPFVLSWYPSHTPAPHPVDGHYAIGETTKWWEDWSALAVDSTGRWREAVQRSEITLKALTYAPTGGIVAAVTTSLPETLGGVRNWDYRYCWLRDATFTLSALMASGYHDEAIAWRDWLLRAVAGDPARLQIMYGPAGERWLNEHELDWLAGYADSRPVRVGNAASDQFQLDVYGEVISALHESRRAGLDPSSSWDLELQLLEFLEDGWRQPDEGIWEVRGPRRSFTHSKVMAWVAADRAVRDVEEFGLEGPADKWRALAADIRKEVLAEGYDAERQTFTQYYGSKALDASCLMIPLVGFLPPSDPRIVGTVNAIQKELTRDGFVLRYDAESSEDVDGLTGREGAFLACSFWLADALDLIGRHDEAVELFERLIALRNDVGLLSEEYDPVAKRLVGNFPQAFSHVSLVNSAVNLARDNAIADEVGHRGRVAGRRFSAARPGRIRGRHLDPTAQRGYRPHH